MLAGPHTICAVIILQRRLFVHRWGRGSTILLGFGGLGLPGIMAGALLWRWGSDRDRRLAGSKLNRVSTSDSRP